MDILERIAVYDCSDAGHSDLAQGSLYDLVEDAAGEIRVLRALLHRYRTETPLGHQPHMIAHDVDAVLGAVHQQSASEAKS